MRTYAGIAVLAFGWLAADAGTASAAWNNVFQTCCHNCRPRVSYSAPACDPCPQPCPTISYKQRCYYCPYTAYKQETYCEPVTTYRTSYYWEPVTSYRYTSYYDPCTGCCQQVATPCTSYRLRSQCCAVQSYVQRCRMVPYTAYRQSCYWEPVVCNDPCPNGAAAPGPGPGHGVAPGVAEPPSSVPGGGRPAPGVSEGDRLPPQNLPNTRHRVTPPATGDAPRLDRIAGNSQGRLQGMIVSDDRITPKAGARVVFASAAKTGPQFSAQADPAGRFSIDLPAGEWNLYMADREGKPVYHSQIAVRGSDRRNVTVVSR